MASTIGTPFQRARTAEQKQQRWDAILAAARRVALRSGVRDATLAMIAEEVGLAPSNVLRYFGTREEIYLQLLGDAWNEWSQELERSLEGVTPGAAAIASVVSRTLCERPLLCDLVAYIGPSFEYNVSVDAVRRMTLLGRERVKTFSILFTGLLSVTEEDAFDLYVALFAFTGNLWMRSHPSEEVAAVYGPEGAGIAFGPMLQRMVQTFIDGLLTQSN